MNEWCVLTANTEDVVCEDVDDDVIIIDEGDADEQTWQFTRNGESMTINATAGALYDFGAGNEAATWTMTLNRVIIEYNRPNITDNTR